MPVKEKMGFSVQATNQPYRADLGLKYWGKLLSPKLAEREKERERFSTYAIVLIFFLPKPPSRQPDS